MIRFIRGTQSRVEGQRTEDGGTSLKSKGGKIGVTEGVTCVLEVCHCQTSLQYLAHLISSRGCMVQWVNLLGFAMPSLGLGSNPGVACLCHFVIGSHPCHGVAPAGDRGITR